MVLAMDAVFGLPRKKAAGISHRGPLFGDLVYLDQSDVDQFVANYQKPVSIATVSALNDLLVCYCCCYCCY